MTADTFTEPDLAVVGQALDQLLAAYSPAITDRRTFLNAQFDAGLAWVHFPVGKGGLGLHRELQSVVYRRLQEAGAPDAARMNTHGYSMGAPLLLACGTEAQQNRYLRPLFVGDERWCQLFSEPGAGSDLAGVATKAVRDGGDWVINGQKVWVSVGSLADVGMLVARTDPNEVKHRGLTYFLVDMHATGVDVRPLRQMTGEAEFDEVFLSDVRVPDTARVGKVGDGWKVSLTTLMNERVMYTADHIGSGPTGRALELFRARTPRDCELRTRVIDLFVRTRIMKLTNARAAANRAAGTPGPEGSTGKIVFAEINQLGYELCVDLLGDEGLLYGSYELLESIADDGPRSSSADIGRRFLRSRANSIEGGTSEIMRNILAERVLGLPPEHRVDKDKPFSQVPRN